MKVVVISHVDDKGCFDDDDDGQRSSFVAKEDVIFSSSRHFGTQTGSNHSTGVHSGTHKFCEVRVLTSKHKNKQKECKTTASFHFNFLYKKRLPCWLVDY